MLDRTNITYEYDGSFEGLLSLIFTCFENKHFPVMITAGDGVPPLFSEYINVETNSAHAERVRKGISAKMGPRALRLIANVYLSSLDDRELHILKFIERGMAAGRNFVRSVADPTVSVLLNAEKYLENECHRYKGFIRFSDCCGVLVATVSPVNNVLPAIAGHFVSRYSGERFIICDKRRSCALVYNGSKPDIVSFDDFVPPEANEREAAYRRLWKLFYNTVAHESRRNEKLRMSHMPLRYWDDLTEMTARDPDLQEHRLPNKALPE